VPDSFSPRDDQQALALAGELGTRPIARAHHLQYRPGNLSSAVGPLTLALSLQERERRLLFLQHPLDHRTGFCYMPVHQEGEC
jgi:hypothetical protein